MGKFTQQELMAAHNIARHSADKSSAEAAADSTVPEPVDPNRKPVEFPYSEPVFGRNDNNRRVAQRIARESEYAGTPTTSLPKTAAESAADDLEKDAAEPDEDEETEQQQLARSSAEIAAGLNAKAATESAAKANTGKTLTPAQRKAQQAVADAAQAVADAEAAAGSIVGEPDPNAPSTPAKPGAAPTWRGNA